MTTIPAELRQRVAARAGGRCEYCQLPQAFQVATFPVDHILPLCRGGQTELSNLALACPRCNATKWIHTVGRDPTTGDEVELFDPRRHVWYEHFAWAPSEPERIESQTAIGRATVTFLNLNAPRHIEIRRWLIAVGEHPPG